MTGKEMLLIEGPIRYRDPRVTGHQAGECPVGCQSNVLCLVICTHLLAVLHMLDQ